MKQRNTVRVRVLQGAIVIGRDRLIKGRTFECDEEYAHELMQKFPGGYEIVPERKSKPAKENISEVTSGDVL